MNGSRLLRPETIPARFTEEAGNPSGKARRLTTMPSKWTWLQRSVTPARLKNFRSAPGRLAWLSAGPAVVQRPLSARCGHCPESPRMMVAVLASSRTWPDVPSSPARRSQTRRDRPHFGAQVRRNFLSFLIMRNKDPRGALSSARFSRRAKWSPPTAAHSTWPIPT